MSAAGPNGTGGGRPEREGSLGGRLVESIGGIFQTVKWDEVLARIVHTSRSLFAADTASLILADDDGTFRVAFSEVDTDEGPKATGQICGDGVATRVARSKRPMVIVGALEQYELFAGLSSRRSGGSSLVYPMVVEDRVLGVLTVNRGAPPAFTAADLAALGVVASFARMAVGNADLYRNLERTTVDLRTQIQERERIEGELRLAQRLEAVGQLAAGVAHEINTPIQYIGDSVQFVRECVDAYREVLELHRALGRATDAGERRALEERIETREQELDIGYLDQEAPRAIRRTLDGTEQVARIVRALKAFSHPTGPEDRSPADLNAAIENTLIVSRNEYKFVADATTNFAALPPVMCNVGDLGQVFLNLIVNAAHAIESVVGHSGERGTITISTSVEPDGVVLAFADTGCGIPPEIQDRIFDPFFTTKDVGRGTGQGLAIARTIVCERHGGSITFASAAGKGTTFYVRLPFEPASSPA
jgi:signal transduction histidine kinase